MEVASNGGDDFAKLARKFRAAGKDGAAIRKALTKKINTRLGRIVAEQKAAVLALNVKGVKGRGTRRRQSFHEAARLRGRNVRTRKVGYGLRSSIAHGIKPKVVYSGRRLGAKIVVETKHLPPSQRSLPKHLDNPRGWRHPLWGNRKMWYRQIGGPYFSQPIERHRVSVRRDVQDAVNEVMRTLK